VSMPTGGIYIGSVVFLGGTYPFRGVAGDETFIP
jgi:hypothetical protein